MATSDRRNIIAAIGSSLALAGLGTSVRLSAGTRTVRYPERAVRLQRVLERGLGQDASLVVTRIWECRFVATQEGAAIEAHQVFVDVAAPPPLAALARIEQQRESTGLFPMRLDNRGEIIGWTGRTIDLDGAIAQARMAIERKGLSEASEAQAKRYVAELGKTAAAIVSQIPRDLFYPEMGQRHEERALALPAGGTGSYELTITASADPVTGFLERSERRIVTRVGDSVRTSSETWSIV